MYAVCIESSRTRGMGHLFRSFQYIEYFKRKGIEFIYLINEDAPSLKILDSLNITYIIVDFSDIESNWERKLAIKYKVVLWFNDKFDTSRQMGKHLSEIPNLTFCAIDDVGEGAMYADLFFAGMLYPTLKKLPGKKSFGGNEYIILNPELNKYKKERNTIKRIIITLGGSDPFGVTVEVAECFKRLNYNIDIVIGPNFKYMDKLQEVLPSNCRIFQNVPSLMQLFSEYDLAVTGGGVTCCEGCASGLPCIIIANAPHEINTGKYIEKMGLGVFAGEHGKWNRNIFQHLNILPINEMSKKGLKCFETNAVERIFSMIENQIREGK